MHQVFLGIGGNIGNKQINFEKVYRIIKNKLGDVTNSSSIYETPPWGFEAKENFWNQVIFIKTEYSPDELLRKIHDIENIFGRKRENEKYNSREMDLDILYFDEVIIDTSHLKIPHIHIPHRLFVLTPLAEIAPNFLHPVLQLTNIQMLENCSDDSVIKKIGYRTL